MAAPGDVGLTTERDEEVKEIVEREKLKTRGTDRSNVQEQTG